jgi:hypothetical protein
MRRNFKVLSFILFILILMFIFFFWFLVHIQKKKRLKDKKYNIKILVQKKRENFLKNSYLAELLDLSVDKQKNIFRFDEKEAILKLLKSPFIKILRTLQLIKIFICFQ